MSPRVERPINRIANQARGRYETWLDSARRQTIGAAGRVRDGKKPVKTLSSLGVKLSGVSHRTTSKVLKQQARMVEHQLDAFARRLKSAAEADNVRDLVRTQLRLIPENASQIVTDTRDTLSIVAGAGTEVRELIAGTVAELRGKAPVAAAKKARAAAKKTKTSKKTKASRKTKTARKTRAKPRAQARVKSVNRTVAAATSVEPKAA